MPPAVAMAGAAVASAGISAIAGHSASKAQQKSAQAGIAEQQRQYDTTRADFAPWRAAGEQALGNLTRAYSGDRSAFTASPGYQFNYDEGLRAIDRGAAARGLLHSGAGVKAEQRFGSGLASNEYNNWWNQGLGLAGLGQNAATTVAQAGQNSANNISNAYQQQGNARASSYGSLANSANSGISNVLFAYLNGGKGGGFGGGG